MLQIDKLKFSFKNKKILRQITFKANVNFVTGLLGPSGAGKTTLFRIISGLIKPTKGNIFWDNKNLNKLPVSKRPISYMQQTFPLYSNLTVLDNVLVSFFNNKDLDKKLFIQNAKNLLKEVGINEEHWYRKPFTLSGGEAQRIALVKALLKPSKILLLDEPFSNIDKTKKRDLISLIKEYVQAENKICLYISHDENDILLMADQLVVIENGELIQTGTPEEILNNPKTVNTASIGSPVGLQIIDKDIIKKYIPFVLSKISNNKISYFGWRSDASRIIFDNSIHKLSSEKLHLKVRINFSKNIGKAYFYNLSLIEEVKKKEIWHQEYVLNNELNYHHKTNAVLSIDLKDIYLLDENGIIIKKGLIDELL